jgi:hypothetical protein
MAARHHVAVPLMRAVGEVDPEDIDAGRDQLAHRGIATRGGAERGHDFRSSHSA